MITCNIFLPEIEYEKENRTNVYYCISNILTGQNNLGFVQCPVPANSDDLTSTYTNSAPQPSFFHIASPALLTTPSRTTLSFSTAVMMPEGSQVSFPDGQAEDTNATAGHFVKCHLDFSEYYNAIEIYGEDYVANSVQL